MDTIRTVSSITPASPRPLFTGLPYLVTRLAPANGIVYSGGLKPVTPIPDTPELAWRYRLFDGFAKGLNGSGRIVFGDLTKGGREARPAELRKLRGARKNGVPRGLKRCRTCSQWVGQCLDPAPQFSGKVMQVHCLCQNRNLCAACLTPLYERKLNANYFDLSDGEIWHVPGFSALAHECTRGTASCKAS